MSGGDPADAVRRGLFRVTRPGGPVVGSVMGLLGSWRFHLADVVADGERVGEDAVDVVFRTGDLRAVTTDPEAHVCRLFRSGGVPGTRARDGGTHILFAVQGMA